MSPVHRAAEEVLASAWEVMNFLKFRINMTELIQRPQRPVTPTITPVTNSQDVVNDQPLSPEDIRWYKEARRPIAEIKADLCKGIPAKYLDKLKDKSKAWYIPWYNAVSLLDRCTGGQWKFRILNMWTTPKRIFVVAEITIIAAEGSFTMAASGTELLEREVLNKETQEIELKELAYGDPSSNAESMALRRAAAKFGLARYLYND
jgi:hypothetical protein